MDPKDKAPLTVVEEEQNLGVTTPKSDIDIKPLSAEELKAELELKTRVLTANNEKISQLNTQLKELKDLKSQLTKQLKDHDASKEEEKVKQGEFKTLYEQHKSRLTDLEKELEAQKSLNATLQEQHRQALIDGQLKTWLATRINPSFFGKGYDAVEETIKLMDRTRLEVDEQGSIKNLEEQAKKQLWERIPGLYNKQYNANMLHNQHDSSPHINSGKIERIARHLGQPIEAVANSAKNEIVVAHWKKMGIWDDPVEISLS